jgi:hypothetical protein
MAKIGFKNVFPLLPLNAKLANTMQGEELLVERHLVDFAAQVDGVITADVDSVFGKGKGEAYGVYAGKTLDSANHVLGFSVAAHSTTAGKLTITMNSTNSSSVVNHGEIELLITGRILPVDNTDFDG